jgi:2-keto-4-pentenoate hydratase/2-oxohepta-3-ene-1,7-dioic acid hydratase in catechol pathway
MHVGNVDGRLSVILAENTAVDVYTSSGGVFSADVQSVYERWDEFRAWAATADLSEAKSFTDDQLGPPVTRPLQIFAVGLNYREHATEAGLGFPDDPYVFTKFASSLTGPYGEIELPEGEVDWEAELVAVVGRRARNVTADSVWDYIAGLTMGQDLSERVLQWAGPPPQQFILGKSYPGFAPVGPVLVTPDEFANPDCITISCTLDGELMQKADTEDMIFSVPSIVEYLSRIVTLEPGDVIFTGTPSGIGWSRTPKRLIQPGDILTTSGDLIGEMRHTFRRAAKE